MFKTTKTQLQLVIEKARLLNCDIKTFVIDADGVYHAKWTARGVDVKLEVTKSETDYMKLNFFNKPHLTLYLTISVRYQQYLIVGIWGEENILESIKNKLLLQKETPNELLERQAVAEAGKEAEGDFEERREKEGDKE